MERLGNNIAMGSETFRDCVLYTSGVDVYDCHKCAARLPRHGCNKETNCPSANDEGGGARGREGAVEGVDGNGKRLEESGRVK